MNTLLKKRWSICFIFVVVFMFLASPSLQVKAAINSNYGANHTGVAEYSDPTATDDDAGIVGLLSLALLQVGHLVEGLVAWLMGLLGGKGVENASFPWSDQIIFNAIPILDVNFINPDKGSLFSIGAGTGNIGTVVRNVYFTGISLAIGFLGIVVAVMSIRMAISTIAAVKAQYKESIVNLLTTLVLIFGLHFLLSGLFYVNEKMVEVASTIVRTVTSPGGLTGAAGQAAGSVVGGAVSGNSSAASTSPNSLSGMGEYFYKTAINEGGTTKLILWDIPAAAPIPTVLYCCFIYQSLVFLVAYFKRFFYVVILSVIGPFVVIYDFFRKIIG